MFETYKLNEVGFDEVRLFKALMADAVEIAMTKMPESREKASFKEKIEEALFWGTRALSSKPENHSEVIMHRPGNF